MDDRGCCDQPVNVIAQPDSQSRPIPTRSGQSLEGMIGTVVAELTKPFREMTGCLRGESLLERNASYDLAERKYAQVDCGRGDRAQPRAHLQRTPRASETAMVSTTYFRATCRGLASWRATWLPRLALLWQIVDFGAFYRIPESIFQ